MKFPLGTATAVPGVGRLVERAYSEAWDPAKDLPWSRRVEWEALDVPEKSCLLAALPAYRKLSAKQKAWVRQREMVSHLSSLADGEQRASTLAAETALLTPGDAEATWFLGTLMVDESKHYSTMSRYLTEKIQTSYPPAPALVPVFAALSQARDFDLNLYVGQVVLEGTAASLLTSLIIGIREPLLSKLLRNVMHDEARHLKFAHLVTQSEEPIDARRRRMMEEILFEAAFAGASCLLATGVWDELGLPHRQCLQATVDGLKEKGVIRFYTNVIARRLRRRGFPSDKLEQLLERMLEGRLRTAA